MIRVEEVDRYRVISHTRTLFRNRYSRERVVTNVLLINLNQSKMNNSTMSTKTQIIDLLRSTNREGIENVINLLENSDFFTAECHSHHKYTGGMAGHALDTYKIARRTSQGVPQDSLIICCLLHDLCDIAGHWEYKGHGQRSADLAVKHCGLKLSKDEWNAIRYHMRNSSKRPDHTPLGSAVFFADKASAVKGFFCRG